MILEILGTIFGFIYLYLEIKQKQGMWVVGFIMALVYAIIYFQQEIYASMCFQIYYILVSIYGFILWGKDKLRGSGNLQEDSSQLENEEHKKAWLIRVTINTCKNWWKSAWHQKVRGILMKI